MATPKAFAFDDVLLLVAGAPIDGLGDGDAIKFERKGDRSISKEGVGGATLVSKRANAKRTTITIVTQYGEASNSILQGIVELWFSTGIFFPIVITELSSGSTYTAVNCWPVKDPSVAFGEEPGNFEWTFETDYMEQLHLPL